MTGEHDTENPGTLADRIGFLPETLHLEQIANFEKAHRAARMTYARELRDACERGEISHFQEQYQDWWIDGFPDEFKWWCCQLELYEEGPTPSIGRDAYREWLTRQGRPLPVWWYPESSSSTSGQSDAALGAQRREQLREFQKINTERNEARTAEWERWKSEAQQIQASHKRNLSKLEISRKVKKSLNLPDSIETIRKKI